MKDGTLTHALERRCPICRALPLEPCHRIPAGMVHARREFAPPPWRWTPRARRLGYALLWTFAVAGALALGMWDALWRAVPWAIAP